MANFVAGGDINPSRFVKMNSADDNQVLECDANERAIGVSQEGTKAAPVSGASTLAAADGDPIHVYTPGEHRTCLLQYGGSITRGGRIKSDADGKGVAVDTSGEVQNVGAIALESGSDGEKHRVELVHDTMPATATNV